MKYSPNYPTHRGRTWSRGPALKATTYASTATLLVPRAVGVFPALGGRNPAQGARGEDHELRALAGFLYTMKHVNYISLQYAKSLYCYMPRLAVAQGVALCDVTLDATAIRSRGRPRFVELSCDNVTMFCCYKCDGK